MLAIASQTARSNGLTIIKRTLEYPGGNISYKKIIFSPDFFFKIRFF